MKKILVLNGSFCEEPIIIRAKQMGYYVVTTGNAPDLIGHKAADEYIACDYSNKEAVLDLVRKNNIEGIISCANDFGVITAAYVAEQMGWKGHDSYTNAVMMHHKDLFKEYCYKKGFPAPHSLVFTSLETAKQKVRGMEYPIIVKANDLTGGKGINRANNFQEAEKALDIAFSMSRDKHIVVEPYIEGTQHSICVFLVNEKIVVSSSCQCYSFKNPYLIQAETFPSREISGEIKQQLESIIEEMAADLHLADGILNLQLIIRDNKPYIIEMMRRCFGNEALLLYQMVTGFDWNEAYIRSALGLNCCDITAQGPIKKYCGHFGVFSDKEGRLVSCDLDSGIENHLFKKRIMIKSGENISNHMMERIMYLYYEYDDVEKMNEDIKSYNQRIKIDIGN